MKSGIIENGKIIMSDMEAGIKKETEGMGAKDIPEVGKVYHLFDDGKIRLSRHCLMECVEVIPFKEFSKNPKYAELFKTWREEVKECDWLYSETTDYIVGCRYKEHPKEKVLYFARTVEWKWWFGFGTFLDNGLLDVTRKAWAEFYEDAHNPDLFGYSDEDLAEIEELNKY